MSSPLYMNKHKNTHTHTQTRTHQQLPSQKTVYFTLKQTHQFIRNWSPDSSCQPVITFGQSFPRLFSTHKNISFINCSNAYLLKTLLWVYQTVTSDQLNNMHFLKEKKGWQLNTYFYCSHNSETASV